MPLFSRLDLHVSIWWRRANAALHQRVPIIRHHCDDVASLCFSGASRISHSHALGARVYPQGLPLPDTPGSHPPTVTASIESRLPLEREGSHPLYEKGNTGSQLHPEKERSHPFPVEGITGSQLPPEQDDIKVNRWKVLGKFLMGKW